MRILTPRTPGSFVSEANISGFRVHSLQSISEGWDHWLQSHFKPRTVAWWKVSAQTRRTTQQLSSFGMFQCSKFTNQFSFTLLELDQKAWARAYNIKQISTHVSRSRNSTNDVGCISSSSCEMLASLRYRRWKNKQNAFEGWELSIKPALLLHFLRLTARSPPQPSLQFLNGGLSFEQMYWCHCYFWCSLVHNDFHIKSPTSKASLMFTPCKAMTLAHGSATLHLATDCLRWKCLSYFNLWMHGALHVNRNEQGQLHVDSRALSLLSDPVWPVSKVLSRLWYPQWLAASRLHCDRQGAVFSDWLEEHVAGHLPSNPWKYRTVNCRTTSKRKHLLKVMFPLLIHEAHDSFGISTWKTLCKAHGKWFTKHELLIGLKHLPSGMKPKGSGSTSTCFKWYTYTLKFCCQRKPPKIGLKPWGEGPKPHRLASVKSTCTKAVRLHAVGGNFQLSQWPYSSSQNHGKLWLGPHRLDTKHISTQSIESLCLDNTLPGSVAPNAQFLHRCLGGKQSPFFRSNSWDLS